MTKREAELTLENHGSNKCYLTRYCTTQKVYLLSVMTKLEEGYKYDHFIIKIEKNYLGITTELEGVEKEFNMVTELLNFYESNPVNFEISDIGVQVQNEHNSDVSIIYTLSSV